MELSPAESGSGWGGEGSFRFCSLLDPDPDASEEGKSAGFSQLDSEVRKTKRGIIRQKEKGEKKWIKYQLEKSVNA